MTYKAARGGYKQPCIQEIGGDFPISKEKINESHHASNVMKDGSRQYISTCRSALREILEEVSCKVQNKVAFVPSFTCHVCVEPFTEAGYDVFPYPIKLNLTIDWVIFRKLVVEHQPAVILIHGYFGFDTLKHADVEMDWLKQRGIILIEDLTHGMWGRFEHLTVPYHIGSIRKWFETPDGAFIQGLHKDLSSCEEDETLVAAKMKGMEAKGEFLAGISENANYRELQLQAEELLDQRYETFRMSDMSICILNTYDINEVMQKRRENYRCLHEAIKKMPQLLSVVGDVSQNETPFQIPVFVREGRKELQQYMVANKIFPTIIWACPEALKDKIDEETQFIYDHILCFHCDHRYDTTDINRIISVLQDYYQNKS